MGEGVWQEQMPRDFAANEALEPKEYFVYFEATMRTVAVNDPASAAAEQLNPCAK